MRWGYNATIAQDALGEQFVKQEKAQAGDQPKKAHGAENQSWMVFVLAGGRSSRMAMTVSKVLLPLGGRPMLDYVLDVAMTFGAVYGVVSPDVRPACHRVGVHWIEQTEPLGTAHAFSLALARAQKEDPDWSSKKILVLMGDTPLVSPQDLQELRASLDDVVVLGMDLSNPKGYGRIIQQNQRAVDIIECKDAQDDQRHVTLCYSGVMALTAKTAADFVESMTTSSVTGEFYLTSVVSWAGSAALVFGTASQFQGVNTRQDFIHIENCMQERFRHRAVEQGALLMSPSTTFLSYDTVVSPGVIIYPMVWIGPGVVLHKGAVIHPHSMLQGCHMQQHSHVGPFARIREDTVVGEYSEIGNFVETKKAVIGPKSKVKHLSYIGDATMGSHVNIGAGVITCNYDGHTKQHTQIGDDVFVGSLSCLVAPVSLGHHSTVGAGSVITRSVDDGTLAVSRAPQKDILLPPSSKHRRRGQTTKQRP